MAVGRRHQLAEPPPATVPGHALAPYQLAALYVVRRVGIVGEVRHRARRRTLYLAPVGHVCRLERDVLVVEVGARGLLLALPLLEGNSEIRLTSPLESASYVEITLRTLERFGIRRPRGDLLDVDRRAVWHDDAFLRNCSWHLLPQKE